MKTKIIKKIFLFNVAIIIIAISLLNLSACKTLGDSILEADTFEVTRGDIVRTVSASGYVDTTSTLNYSLSATGEVEYTLDEGDTFNKGDVLFEIDNSRQELLVAQAEENLNISKDSLELAGLSYQQALDANHIAVQLAGLNADLAEQATQSAYSALENANELARDSIGSASAALENARNISIWLVESAKIAWDNAEEAYAIAFATGPPALAEQYAAEAAEANYEAVKAQQRANTASAEGAYETTKEQSGSSVDSAQSAYEQSLLNQSSTYWTNLSSTQNAESQIAITGKNIDQAEAQLHLSEISLELAKMDLDDGTIYAPYDGIVLSSSYSSGEYAGPGVPAISIIGNDFVVKAEVNETDIVNLEEGQETEVRLDAYYDHAFDGKIARISPVSSNLGGVVSFEITVEFNTQDGPEVLYGFSASLDIITSSAENVLYVPLQYVYEEDGISYVNVLTPEGDKVKTEVTTGISNYDLIEIESGLNKGDIVTTSSI